MYNRLAATGGGTVTIAPIVPIPDVCVQRCRYNNSSLPSLGIRATGAGVASISPVTRASVEETKTQIAAGEGATRAI